MCQQNKSLHRVNGVKLHCVLRANIGREWSLLLRRRLYTEEDRHDMRTFGAARDWRGAQSKLHFFFNVYVAYASTYTHIYD